jgi:hypothetical protein
MPRPAIFPELHDADWLRARYVNEGLQQSEIAALIGCATASVGHALKRLGVTAKERSEPEPIRRFVPLASRIVCNGRGGGVNLAADVAADELARRVAEGLTDLAELTRLAGELPRERLWALVVDEVDAPTARMVAFAAASLAAEQSRRVAQAA